MLSFFQRFGLLFALTILMLTGCSAGNNTGGSEEAARVFLSKRLPKAVQETLRFQQPIAWKQGQIVVYEAIFPPEGGIPQQSIAGYFLLEQRNGQWQVIDGSSISINKALSGQQGTVISHVAGDGYALVFGQVAANVAELEVLFDTGATQQVKPVDQIIMAIEADSRGACRIHTKTNQGAIEEVSFGPPRPTARDAQQIMPNCG